MCESINHDDTTKVANDDIFKEDIQHLRKIAKKVDIIIDILVQLVAQAPQGTSM